MVALMQRQQGVVLVTGLFLITLLSVFLLSLVRSAAWSQAASRHDASRAQAQEAADRALVLALSATSFERTTTTRSMTLEDGLVADVTLDYLGVTTRVPHPEYDADRDHNLRAHHWRVAATVQVQAAIWHAERDFAVIAAAGIASSARISTAPAAHHAPFGSAILIGAWRGW